MVGVNENLALLLGNKQQRNLHTLLKPFLCDWNWWKTVVTSCDFGSASLYAALYLHVNTVTLSFNALSYNL